MSAELRVVLVDEGKATPPDPGNATTTEFPPGPRARDPEEQASRGPRADRWRGTPRDDGKESGPVRGAKARGPTEGSDAIMAELKRAVTTAADAIGAGGLARHAISLADGFQRLLASIAGAAAARAVESTATGVRAARSARPSPTVGARAPDFETIDADFEVKGPRPTPAATGAKPGLGGLIVPPRGLTTQGAKTTVQTLAVTGARAVAPVAGASATAGGSAAIMAQLAAAAGPAAIAVGALAAVTGAAVVGVKKLIDVFDHEADRLQGFNASLAGAKATADIRNTMNDLRRAQRIGPNLAGFTDRESRFNEASSRFYTEVLQELLKIEELLSPLTENSIAALQAITEALPLLISLNKYHQDGLKIFVDAVSSGQAETIKLLRRWFGWMQDESKEENSTDPFMDQFLAEFVGDVERPGRPAMPPAGVPLIP